MQEIIERLAQIETDLCAWLNRQNTEFKTRSDVLDFKGGHRCVVEALKRLRQVELKESK